MAQAIGPFAVHYEAGHSYDRTYVKTGYFCPACGVQTVWEEDSDGDYYAGSDYNCSSCGAKFNIPTLIDVDVEKMDWQQRQIYDALRLLPVNPNYTPRWAL